MNLYKHIVALGALTVITALPAAVQVEKVAIKTTGISCGTRAAVSEIYLRRLPSIDKKGPLAIAAMEGIRNSVRMPSAWAGTPKSHKGGLHGFCRRDVEGRAGPATLLL